MDPSDDSLQARTDGEQDAADAPRVVRRIEITVEREITTVILRRRYEPSGPNLPAKPPAGSEDGN